MRTRLGRRELLAATVQGLVGSWGVSGRLARAEVPPQAPVRRVGGPRLKTSLNAYSFSKALNDQLKGREKGFSLLDLLEFCAELNFDALDPTAYFFEGYPKVPADSVINQFKRRAFQLGVEISGTGVRNDFATTDRAKRAADVRHVTEWIECAARMGAPVIRVFAGPLPAGASWDEVSKWMADDLRACTEVGKRHGVMVGVQNHGDALKSADDVLKLVKMVDSDWFGVIVDTGYFLTPDPYQDIARVVPYAVNWQIKEKTDGPKGTHRTDLKRLVTVIKDGGYRGYLPIETLSVAGEPYDPRARVARLLNELREALREE